MRFFMLLHVILEITAYVRGVLTFLTLEELPSFFLAFSLTLVLTLVISVVCAPLPLRHDIVF